MMRLDTSRAPRRHRTTKQRRHAGDRGVESEYVPVERQVEIDLIDITGKLRDQQLARPPGEEQTQGTRDGRQECGFHKHLARDCHPPGTERQPYPHVVASRCGASDQEVCHVGTCDQEYERDQHHQDRERLLESCAQRRPPARRRDRTQWVSHVPHGKLSRLGGPRRFSNFRLQPLKDRSRGIYRLSWPEAQHDAQPVSARLVESACPRADD
jgi:hypothetical protein